MEKDDDIVEEDARLQLYGMLSRRRELVVVIPSLECAAHLHFYLFPRAGLHFLRQLNSKSHYFRRASDGKSAFDRTPEPVFQRRAIRDHSIDPIDRILPRDEKVDRDL